ncbi:MAG: YqiA/YcfP family alpha/beta fold hydrolase [Candidatus Odinarchaeota archaeon]
MTRFIYLHGLLSSSKSTKGILLKKHLASRGDVYTPDFYPERKDFEGMTVTSLLERVAAWIGEANNPVVLLGSSFGGLMATRYLQLKRKNSERVKLLILLAPALEFYHLLKERIVSTSAWKEWQDCGYQLVQHPAWTGETKWSWDFVLDLKKNHSPMDDPVTVPTLLVHGEDDEVIPAENSRHYAIKQAELGCNWSTYFLPGGNHQLSNIIPEMIEIIDSWLEKHLSW